MTKDLAARRALLKILDATTERLDMVRGTPADIAAEAAFNRAGRMLDAFDAQPGDETPPAVVRFLWRPWEHEQVDGPIGDQRDQRIADAEHDADVARSWGRNHEEAHFRALANTMREQLDQEGREEERAG
jgi:hypothetical protein